MSPGANDADSRYGTGRCGMGLTSGDPEQGAGTVPGGAGLPVGIGDASAYTAGRGTAECVRRGHAV